MEKTIVMLLLCRRVIADLLIESIEKNGNVDALGIYDYDSAVNFAAACCPDIALVEIPEKHGTPALDTLDICHNIKGTSPGCKIVGPAGEVEISEGVIAAKRHVHLRPEDAEKFGVQDKQIVQVKVKTDGRTTTFGDVVIRVNAEFMPYMHIDTDEANACAASGNVEGEILI